MPRRWRSGSPMSVRDLFEPRHIRRSRARRGPQETAILKFDRHVVDRGLTPLHQAGFVEFPLLVAVGAKPRAAFIVPLILEAHRDPVLVIAPQILDQPIVALLRPF